MARKGKTDVYLVLLAIAAAGISLNLMLIASGALQLHKASPTATLCSLSCPGEHATSRTLTSSSTSSTLTDSSIIRKIDSMEKIPNASTLRKYVAKKEAPESFVTHETNSAKKETPEPFVSHETDSAKKEIPGPSVPHQTDSAKEETSETFVSHETDSAKETHESFVSHETDIAKKETPEPFVSHKTDSATETSETILSHETDNEKETPELSQETDRAKETPAWPSLGRCTPNGWPAAGFTIGLFEEPSITMVAFEVEKASDEDMLDILISATSMTSNTSTLLNQALPYLKCDFRRGNVAMHARFASLHRAPVEMTILAEDKAQGYVAARLRCALPSPDVLDVADGQLLPSLSKVQGFDPFQRAHEDKYTWLHWQLFFQSNSTESNAGRSWLVSPSLGLCNTTSQDFSQWTTFKHTKAKEMGPSASDYVSRGDEDGKGTNGWTSTALCVAPRPFTDSLRSWATPSVEDWVVYQRVVLGITSIIYLDPFGEELLLDHPEISVDIGHQILHVPHTAAHHNTMASLMREGPVAEFLARERCSRLARQMGIEYVLHVNDPMNLPVPMKRRLYTLPSALVRATRDGCANTVRMSKTIWSLDKEASSDEPECHFDWCNLTDATDSVSRFLMGGRPVSVQEPAHSEIHFWRATAQSSGATPCMESAFIPGDRIQMVVQQKSQPRITSKDAQHMGAKVRSFQDGTLDWLFVEISTWIRHQLKVLRLAHERELRHSQRSSAALMPVSRLKAMPMHMCRSDSDKGPVHAEAVITQPTKSSTSSALTSTTIMQLTFFSAEVASVAAGKPALIMSVYAEDAQSRAYSHYHDWAWGVLFQSINVQHMLPNVTCIFSHPDPDSRSLNPRGFRTQGEWRSFIDVAPEYLTPENSRLLLWLECPLPSKLPLPRAEEMSSLVTIEETGPLPAGMEMHMIRSMQICAGGEEKEGCDDISLACRVGCVDDTKAESDPTARCCERCHENHHRYSRFDERDYWTPEIFARAQERVGAVGLVDSQTDRPLNTSLNPMSSSPMAFQPAESSAALPDGDLSICLKPFFFNVECSKDCGESFSLSPQRVVEWIEYHLLVGFDVIYVLDRYGHSLLPLLQRYVDSGRVIHVPFPILSDLPFSPEAQSDHSRIIPEAFDQVMSFEKCLSMGRQRGDAFTALIDVDEFVKYPQAQAGGLRAAIGSLLPRYSYGDRVDALPDSIVLDRFDVKVEREGLALGYSTSHREPRKHRRRGKLERQGKVLVRPQAMVYGGVVVHDACTSAGCDNTGILVAAENELSILHFRQMTSKDYIDYKTEFEKGEKVLDSTLKWAHDILAAQLMSTAGASAMNALSSQGLLRLAGRRSSEGDKKEEKQTNVISASDKRPLLFIGILSYCATRDRRDAVRQTWLSPQSLQQVEERIRIRWGFVLGQATADNHSEFCTAQALEREIAEFGDLVILDGLVERYQVITRKTLAMFSWANANVDADFLLKTDDDSYVHLPAVVSDLMHVDSLSVPIYWGEQQPSVSVWLSTHFDGTGGGRWFIKPEDMPRDTQSFSTGAGYLLSRPLVQYLATIFTDIDMPLPWGPEDRLGWVEDAAVGYLLRGAVNRAGRVRANPPHGIYDAWEKLRCEGDFDFTVIHHLNWSQQYDLHRILHSEQGYNSRVCEQLLGFQVDMPELSSQGREESAKWGGSFLDRPISPLLTMSPLPFKAPPSSTKSTVVAPDGRDVIVVTGGAHNIGRYLVNLIQHGYSRLSGPITVVVLDSRAADAVSIFSDLNHANVHADVTVKLMRVDITDFEAVNAKMSIYRHRIRGVVHLAAISRVQDCHQDLQRCEDVNVGGTENIMRALWSLCAQGAGAADIETQIGRAPLPWIIFASSREVYGALRLNEVVDENSPLRPLNVYGKTKLKAEKALRLFARKTGFNVVTLRFSNVYGSCHDHKSRLVPNMVSKLVSGNPFVVSGSGDKTISMLHVRDAVQALLLGIGYADALDNAAGYYDAFNIGGGPSHDVLNIKDIYNLVRSTFAEMVPNCISCHKEPIVNTTTVGRAPEPDHYQSNIDKAFRVLGYWPSQTFDKETLRGYMSTCEVTGGGDKSWNLRAKRTKKRNKRERD